MSDGAVPDQVVGGRFQLVRELASGAFGRVWKARDLTLDINVALKEMQPRTAMSPQERAEWTVRAAREARNAAKLSDHPNVVTVRDVLIEDGVPWIVMQHVPGKSLARRLRDKGRLPVDEVARIASSMLDALDAAHANGIVHRDVKPANIMIAKNGNVVLVDFGIAVRSTDGPLTLPGTVIGTVEYMAPERVRGEQADAPSDLFSLGATLYHAVEGRPPFDRATIEGAMSAVLFDEPPPAAHAGWLAPLIEGLLVKDPLRRMTIARAREVLKPSVPPTKPLGVREVPPPVRKAPERRAPERRTPERKPEVRRPATPPVRKPAVPRSPDPQPPTPKPPTSTPSAPKPTPPKPPQTTESKSWLGWLAAAAIVFGLLWGHDTGFANWVSPVLNDDIWNADETDCVHYIDGDGDSVGRWVQVPCWSAATKSRVMERYEYPAQCGPLYTSIDFTDPDTGNSGTLCVY